MNRRLTSGDDCGSIAICAPLFIAYGKSAAISVRPHIAQRFPPT